jgi:hypothetical protein
VGDRFLNCQLLTGGLSPQSPPHVTPGFFHDVGVPGGPNPDDHSQNNA